MNFTFHWFSATPLTVIPVFEPVRLVPLHEPPAGPMVAKAAVIVWSVAKFTVALSVAPALTTSVRYG